jgi:hypothetical protein
MTTRAVLGVGALIVVTALSAFFDAKGFVYAAQAWRSGSLNAVLALYSLVYFIGGVTLYIASIGFQQSLGVQSAAVQSIFWFAMTVLGVALMDGSIVQWSIAERVVGVAVAVGIAWLLVKSSH